MVYLCEPEREDPMTVNSTTDTRATVRAYHRGWTSRRFDEAHFTVSNGKIVRLRQIHDTAAIRGAGFGKNV
jgi:hypothetical protein